MSRVVADLGRSAYRVGEPPCRVVVVIVAASVNALVGSFRDNCFPLLYIWFPSSRSPEGRRACSVDSSRRTEERIIKLSDGNASAEGDGNEQR